MTYSKGTVVVPFVCLDHPSGELFIVVTGQTWIDPDGNLHDPPLKTCRWCGRMFPAPMFIKGGKPHNDGYFLFEDDDVCRNCVPAERVPLNLDRFGHACYRLTMRDERGEPYRTFDIKSRQWRALQARGVRRMTPTGNILRLQPYGDRRHDADGVPYDGTRYRRSGDDANC